MLVIKTSGLAAGKEVAVTGDVDKTCQILRLGIPGGARYNYVHAY